MPSALEQPQVVREYLAKESSGALDSGRIPPGAHQLLWSDPQGFHGRFILDMFSLEGMSVNDGIQEASCSLSYVSGRTQPRG